MREFCGAQSCFVVLSGARNATVLHLRLYVAVAKGTRGALRYPMAFSGTHFLPQAWVRRS
jgi:hypothetical protein